MRLNHFDWTTKGLSRCCNFAPWDKGQSPHGALFHAAPGCYKCFQQCRIAGSARVGTLGSYLTLLEAFASPWDRVEQRFMGRHCPLFQREKLHRLDRPLVVSVTSPKVLTCISMETLSNAISLRVSRRWIASWKSFVCGGSKSVKSFGANQEVMDANRMRWEISCGPATDSFPLISISVFSSYFM